MNTFLLTAVLLAAIQGGKYINNIRSMMCTSEASTIAKPYPNSVFNLSQEIIAFMQVSRFVCNMRVCLWVHRRLSFK